MTITWVRRAVVQDELDRDAGLTTQGLVKDAGFLLSALGDHRQVLSRGRGWHNLCQASESIH